MTESCNRPSGELRQAVCMLMQTFDTKLLHIKRMTLRLTRCGPW